MQDQHPRQVVPQPLQIPMFLSFSPIRTSTSNTNAPLRLRLDNRWIHWRVSTLTIVMVEICRSNTLDRQLTYRGLTYLAESKPTLF